MLQCQGFFSPDSTTMSNFESSSPMKSTKRDTLVVLSTDDSIRPSIPNRKLGYTHGREYDTIGEHVINSLTSPTARVQTAQGKQRMFINQTLNEFMNSEIQTQGDSSTRAGGLTSMGMSPAKAPPALMSLHKHSKLLNFQMPLAASN